MSTPYDLPMKLKQLAVDQTPESRLLGVQPFDGWHGPGHERALKESKIGITLRLNGKNIRCQSRNCQKSAQELARSLSKWPRKRWPCAAPTRRTALDKPTLKTAGE